METKMKLMRLLWLIPVFALGMILAAAGTGRCEEANSSPASAAIDIPEYIELSLFIDEDDTPLVPEKGRALTRCEGGGPSPGVDVAGKVSAWGQGVRVNGAPNYDLSGGAPAFVGGATGDHWPNGQTVPYCHGAVGRARVTVKANSRRWLNLRVAPASRDFLLLGKPGATISAVARLGWDNGCGMIVVGTSRLLRVHRSDSSTWLYVMARRRGLLDAPGLYGAIVTLEVSAL
jgi:hypothetical protein